MKINLINLLFRRCEIFISKKQLLKYIIHIAQKIFAQAAIQRFSSISVQQISILPLRYIIFVLIITRTFIHLYINITCSYMNFTKHESLKKCTV